MPRYLEWWERALVREWEAAADVLDDGTADTSWLDDEYDPNRVTDVQRYFDPEGSM